jgi:hypothetical protein
VDVVEWTAICHTEEEISVISSQKNDLAPGRIRIRTLDWLHELRPHPERNLEVTIMQSKTSGRVLRAAVKCKPDEKVRRYVLHIDVLA